MVYESDFYTTRRPYSRPTITSYSVTGNIIPYIAHKRLNLSTPPPAFRLRSSVLLGELDRIYNRPRPHLASVPTEDFLCSRPLVSFDDETKLIRAQTQALMRKVHAPVPRSSRPLILSGAIPYSELTLPERITSDPYIKGMLEPYNTVYSNINNISHYNEPSRTTIGRGHLACVSYAGGRGYPRRKHLYSDENRDIRDEIKFRSYYDKARMAASDRRAANILPTGTEEQAS